MIKTLAGQVKEFKKDSIITPIFMILEVIMEMIIPLLTRNDSQKLYDKYRINFTGDGVSREQLTGGSTQLSGNIGLNIKFNGDSTQLKYGNIREFTYQSSVSPFRTLTTRGFSSSHDSVNTKVKGIVLTTFTMAYNPSNIDKVYLEIRVNESLVHSIKPTSFQEIGNKQYNAGFNIDATVSLKQEDTLFFVLNIDFIKAIASMVGLFALPDGVNGIKFIPFDNLSANKSKAVDWTNRVIMAYRSATPRSLKYTLDNIAQNNRFRYKEGKRGLRWKYTGQ